MMKEIKEIAKLPEKEESQRNLTVAVRVRPINDAEVEYGCTDIVHVINVENMVVLMDPSDDPDDILRANRSREKQYVFDLSFGPASSQKEVYEQTTKDLIESVIDGYNATVFAYGPTGAGKTHTMLGVDSDPGIMVRTLNSLFKKMELTSSESNYEVTMSYLEIYNEMIRDLLNPSSGYLDLREDSKGVVVAGLSEMTASTTKEVMQMLSMGNKQRTCEPTAVNKTSSRSHAVLQVIVKQKSRIRNIIEEVKVGKLFMVDLAGSERAANTQNRGKRLIEGAHINRSLLALGNCINALCERGVRGSQYINFRDSKLTRLLKDSLGGNCRTVMIAHISPASMCFEESKNTLNYADRAKNIKLKVKRNQYNVNYHIAQYQSIIAELRQEILRLKTKMVDSDLKSEQGLANSATFRGCKETKVLEKLRAELIEGFQEQMEYRRQLIDLDDSAMRMSIEYARHMLVIDEWERDKAKRQGIYELEQSNFNGDATRKPQTIKKKIVFRKSKQDTFDLDSKDLNTEKNLLRSYDEGWEPADVTAAREEIQQISLKEKDILDQKKDLKEKLDELRKDRLQVEDSLPRKISCDGHRELLKLLCNVHELELKNAELGSLALLKDHLMQQGDINLQRQEMRQKLSDEIIALQRTALEASESEISAELEVLYQMYQKQLFESDSPFGSPTASLGAAAASKIPDTKLIDVYGTVSMPSLTTVMEAQMSNTRLRQGESGKQWIDSVSDFEADEVSRRDIPAVVNGPSSSRVLLPSFLRQDTSTTFTFDDDPSAAEDNDHLMLKSKRIKRRGIRGVMSDNEISRRGRTRGQVSRKVIRSDTKLVNQTKLNEKGFVRTSNSMNDLSLVKTPRNDESSVEDLQKIDDDMEERRRRPRQRSSSLDMGREKLRFRREAKAAEKKASRKLAKKGSDLSIPIHRLERKKISMDEMSVVTVDSKVNYKYLPNEDDGKNAPMSLMPSSSRNAIGKKGQKPSQPEKLIAFGGTMNVQPKPKTRSTKENFADGLAVSGFSVTPKQLRPGYKRY